MQQSYSPDGASSNKGEVTINGAFSVNGTSSPVAYRGPSGLGTDLPNGIVSVAYAATGAYTLTFTDNFYACTSVQVHLGMGTAADSVAQFNGFTNLGSGTLTALITTLTAGSAAAVSAASGNEVFFTFTFKRTAAK